MPTLKPSRIRVLHVSTPQGHAGALIKDSRHSFTYAPEILDPPASQRAISLTMPLRAAPWARTTMLPAFQTFLPEGFLRERITEKLGKAMRVDDMALLAFSGENAIGRLRVSASRDAAPSQKGENIVRSSCVGCGICSAVCPRGVLKLENASEKGRINSNDILLGNDVNLMDLINQK